jgi:hypothetical protein
VNVGVLVGRRAEIDPGGVECDERLSARLSVVELMDWGSGVSN